MSGSRWLLITLGCGFLFFTALPKAATLVSPADRDVIQERQRSLLDQAEQQRELLRNSTSLETLPSTSPVAPDTLCFTIDTISFMGTTRLSTTTQRQLAQPYLHRCLTLDQINQLVREVTNHYIQAGYITSRAYLEQQDISSRVLALHLEEGRIEAITLDGKTPLSLRMAFPGLLGQVLNLRDIEQGMEQINRQPSQQVTIDIQPGQQPGYSVVALQRTHERLPLSLYLGADNSGQKSTGTNQISAGFTLDNPFGLADQWSLNTSRNSDFRNAHRSRSLNGGVSQPYGYWCLQYQYAWNDFYYQLPLNGNAYRYQGQNKTHRFSLNRTLYRDGERRLALDSSLSRRSTENTLAGERLAISSPTLTSLNMGLNYSSTLIGGYFTFTPALTHGLRAFRATPNDRRFADAPRSEYRKFSLNSSYFFPLTDSLSYLTTVYGQTTPDNLYASERLSIGGEYSVRGFKEQSLTGNRGAYWRNELTWQVMTLPLIGNVAITGALDSGWLQSKSNQIDGGNLTGTALTLSLNGRWISQTFSLGAPLSHPDSLHPDHWITYWQVTLTL